MKLTYLVSGDDDIKNTNLIEGLAVKLPGGKWQTVSENGVIKQVAEEDLLDGNTYYIKHAFQAKNIKQQQKEAQKAKQ